MTTLDDGQKSFEKKFERDQDLQFKANARRNKLLGLWAAEVMGKSDTEDYAKEVIRRLREAGRQRRRREAGE